MWSFLFSFLVGSQSFAQGAEIPSWGTGELPSADGRSAVRGSYDGQALRLVATSEVETAPSSHETGSLEETELRASETEDRPGSAGSQEIALAIPPEARRLPLTWKVQALRGGALALWVRWGEEEEHYSVVALGPSPRSSGHENRALNSRAPRVVFRGWSRLDGSHLSWVVRGDAVEAYVVGEERRELCGREVATSLRRLNPSTGHFAWVRVPPLTASERQAAQSLAVYAAPEGGVRLHLSSTAPSAATDGSQDSGFDRPYSFFEVTRLSESRHWVLELGEASIDAAERELYLATDQHLYRLVFPPDSARQWSLMVPEAARCAALVQGSRALNVLEVVAHIDAAQPTWEELVARLDQPEPGWAPRALAEGGNSAMQALALALPRLSDLGRRRALSVARSVSVSGPVLLAALETEHRAEALAELRDRGTSARPVLIQALESAPRAALDEVVESLVVLDPRAAIDDVLLVLPRVAPERARRLVAVLAGLQHPSAREYLEQLVLKWPASWNELDPLVAAQLIRKLGPRVPEPKVRNALLVHSSDAEFEVAYSLLPLVVRSARTERGLRERLSDWLENHAGWGESEHAALSVAILEALASEESPLLDREEAGLLTTLLHDENARVRAAMAHYLSSFPSAKVAPQLVELGRSDPWPFVRRSVVTALGAVLEASRAGTSQAPSEDVEAYLIRRSRSDDDVTVRREAVSALAGAASIRSLKSLRRSLQKDTSAAVRAEAALSLGRRCDLASVELLFGVLGALERNRATEGDVTVALAALTALLRIGPPSLDAELQHLLEAKGLGPLQPRIEAQLSVERGQCVR